MKIFISLPPCLKCLTVCPKCQHLDGPQREDLAQVAWNTLHHWFPNLVPPEPEDEQEGK